MNNLILISAVLILIVAGIYYFAPYKTLYLIARVSPFEQKITNAPTVLVLGDSTGYGTGATDAAYTVPGRLGRDFAVTIENNSKNGRTIGELSEVTSDISENYELILLMIGANDVLQMSDIDTVETELREIISDLTPHTNHLVMISSGNVGGAPRFNSEKSADYEALTRKYRDMFLAVSNETSLQYVDLFLEPENDPFITDSESHIAVDGLHPSNVGYEHWYSKLKPVVTPLLSEYQR